MRVAIRTDASSMMGTGHVMRCLTLADALRTRGLDVVFVCREHAGHLCDFINDKGYRVHRLSPPSGNFNGLDWNRHALWLGVCWEQDARETIETLRNDGEWDWLVVDHYALDRRWEILHRPLVKRIMVIDDLADRTHDCDLLLDQNLIPEMGIRYEALVPKQCEKLLGPEFALLRPEFANARREIPPRSGIIKRITVFMGGSDPANATGKVLDALDALQQWDVQVDLVVGAQSVHRAALKSRVQTMSRVVWHEPVANMADLMGRADLAIGAGGTTVWERACLGLPSLVLSIADNQTKGAETFGEGSYCLYLGRADEVSAQEIAQALATLRKTSGLLRHFAATSRQLVDGRGVERVVRRLIQTIIRVRPAVAEDCGAVFQWRNAPPVRANFFDPEPIPWEGHQRWFAAALEAMDRILLIGETEGRAVGVVRYDLEGQAARVSVYLVPAQFGRGLGADLLQSADRWLGQNRPEIRVIKAEILPGNEASRKAFVTAGYALSHSVYRRTVVI